MSDTVFVGGYVPADLAAAVRERARSADRSFSAELRLALRERVTAPATSEAPAATAEASRKTARHRRHAAVHDLRHTFGTAMAGAGVPMRTLQEWMGHRDVSTTQRYADYAPNPHEVAMAEAAFPEGTRSPQGSSILTLAASVVRVEKSAVRPLPL